MKRTILKRKPGGLKKYQEQLKKKGSIKKKPKTEEEKAQQKEDIERMWVLFIKHWEDTKDIYGKHWCEECSTAIWGENKSLYHHHCWPKAKYPEYKYDIEGLILLCGNCHSNIENGNMTEKTRKKIEKIKQNVLDKYK